MAALAPTTFLSWTTNGYKTRRYRTWMALEGGLGSCAEDIGSSSVNTASVVLVRLVPVQNPRRNPAH